MVVVWNYETDPGSFPCSIQCGGGSTACSGCTQCSGCPFAWNTLPQTPGAFVLARDETDTDWTLVGLSLDDAVPSGLYYLGWNANSLDNGSAVTCIHHPRGSFKRITFGEKINNNGSCNNATEVYHTDWPAGEGVTELGSSGSPLLGSQGRVRGVLSCGPLHTCGQDNEDRYGQFDVAYDSDLHPYLNPANPVYVDGAASGGTGTSGDPFGALFKGLYAVREGSVIIITPGTYGATWACTKAMELRADGGSVIIGE
jgi:hypothetical protein